MKKTILLILALGTCWILQAAIVYVDLQPDSIILMDQFSSSYRAPLDFGNTSVNNFEFRYDDWRKPPANGTEWFFHCVPSFSVFQSNEMVLKGTATNPYGGRYVDPLTKGTVIGPNSNWGTSSPEPFVGDSYDPNFMGLGDRYIGVTFEPQAFNIHYGWILVNFDNNQTLTIKGFAYEDVPTIPIIAGDTASPFLPISSISINGRGGANHIQTKGGTLQIEYTLLPINATNRTITWSVIPGTGNATIDQNGLLTAVADGTVTVEAISNDGSGVKGSMVVTIRNQIQLVRSISLAGQGGQTVISTPRGTLQMIPNIAPANADDTTLTWSIVNGTGKAVIDATGLVAAKEDGEVTVVAASNDGSNVRDSLRITISNQPLLVNFIRIGTQGSGTIVEPGGTLLMKATVLPALAGDKSLSWQIQNLDGRASVSSSGVVQAQADGKVRVIAHALDGSGIYSSPFEITIYNQALSVDPKNGLAFSLSPNPVSDVLTIKSERQIAQIVIMTTAGKQIHDISYAMSAQGAGVNLKNLRQGIYFIKVVDIDGRYSVKPVSKL